MQIDKRLKDIINNRIVGVMSHGCSIEELEKRITEYKDLDICWVSLNQFPMMENYILEQIGKHLSIIYDSATVPNSRASSFERIRKDRLSNFLCRPEDNLWITTKGLIRDYIKPQGYGNFVQTFNRKIVVIDEMIPQHLLDVPNSLTLLISAVTFGGAKKIILFGVDGYRGLRDGNLDSYYKPELQAEERKVALGDPLDSGIVLDTNNFINKFWSVYRHHCNLYHISQPEIINCNDNPTIYRKLFKHIKYKELREVCNE